MKRFFSHSKIGDLTSLDPEAWLVESRVQTQPFRSTQIKGPLINPRLHAL